ncbi:MAG: hypothetical protein ABI845_06050 [Polaromonas sp.]
MAHAGEETGYLASIALSWREDLAIGQGPAGSAIRSGQPEQTGDVSTAADFFLARCRFAARLPQLHWPGTAP